MAMTLLNYFDVADMAGIVLSGDYKELTRAKGVGQKLAQKIILELKDKFTSYENLSTTTNNVGKVSANSQNVQDAKTVLLSLGYNTEETETAVKNALSRIDNNAPAEEILKESLRLLSIS